MNNKDYNTKITTPLSQPEAFALMLQVNKWWTENLIGFSDSLNDEFAVQFGDVHYSKQKIVECVPHEKVVWLVTDSLHNWLNDKKEWTGTKVIFELSNDGNQTTLNFTHQGLQPDVECYDQCSKGWDYYIEQSLQKLLNEGQGMPDKKA